MKEAKTIHHIKSVSVALVSQLCTQGFFKFITATGVTNNVIRPWMKAREIDVLKELLLNLKPKKCLEWGSGYSSLYYPQYIPADAQWISVEHESNWFEKIHGMNKNSHVHIHLIEPNQFPWTDMKGDGAYADLVDYINFPSKFGCFDFILVDGRARVECIKKAASILSANGIVILHDANRTRYEEPWQLFKYQVLFRDYRDSVGGFWIGSHSVDIRGIIDVEKQLQLWKLYNTIGRNSFGRMLRL